MTSQLRLYQKAAPPFGGCCPLEKSELQYQWAMGETTPKSHPSVVKAEIPIALYEEINFSASF